MPHLSVAAYTANTWARQTGDRHFVYFDGQTYNVVQWSRCDRYMQSLALYVTL